jgi:hypothetical protein
MGKRACCVVTLAAHRPAYLTIPGSGWPTPQAPNKSEAADKNNARFMTFLLPNTPESDHGM